MSDFVEHKLLQGQGAGKWLPFARSKVAILHARARASEITALSQRWTVEGGMVEVAVRVVGDQRYIHIRRVQCPPFLSGFLDAVGGTGGDGINTIPNPSPPPATIEIFRRFYPSPAQTEPPRAWRDEPGLTNSGPQMVRFDPPAVKASMFSGEMRKVVQILQGMDIEVNYTHIGASTNGVYKAANGQRWIIEISNQGVVAWVMGMCRSPIRALDGEILLDYTPLYSPKPLGADLVAARLAGTYIDLLPAAGLQDFYTKAMYSLAISWAFSGDGHEAANVCTGADSNAPIGFLYKLQITETENRPTSATLIEVEHGYLAIDTDRTHMKYPVQAGSELLFSYDTGNYLPVNTNAPVYCYYDGLELQVFRVVFSQGAVTFNDNEESPCYPCSAFTVPPNDSGGSYLVSGNYSNTEVPHFVAGSAGNPSVLAENSYAATFRTRHAAPEPLGINATSSQCVFNFNELYNLGGSQTTLQGAELVRNVLAVPAYDREAVYIGGKIDGSPVLRTAYSAFSSIGGGGEFLPGSCSVVLGTYITSAVDRCPEDQNRCSSVSLGTTHTDPTAIKLCSNGVRPYGYGGCSGSSPYFPFAPVFANNGCGSPPGVATQASFTCVNFSDTNPISIGSLSATTVFSGSGGAQAVLSPRVAQNPFETDLYQFSEFPVALVSIRDAFDGRKYIISPDQGKLVGSVMLSAAGDYPVNEAGAGMAFVGVP